MKDREPPEQIDQLAAQADQMRAKNKRAKTWPRFDETAYLLHSAGFIEVIAYSSGWDRELAQGNIFRTREEAEAERDYRAMRQRAREAFRAQKQEGYVGIQTGRVEVHYWYASPYDLMLANLGLAFNDTPKGRALAEAALAVYQRTILREWPR